jgi:hypothetical protein
VVVSVGGPSAVPVPTVGIALSSSVAIGVLVITTVVSLIKVSSERTTR